MREICSLFYDILEGSFLRKLLVKDEQSDWFQPQNILK